MKTIHKISSALIFTISLIIAAYFRIDMSVYTAQNLVTFFSVVFGFEITSIAILFESSYLKRLHDTIDDKLSKRGTQILKSYLQSSGHLSILSIVLIILFSNTEFTLLSLPLFDKIINQKQLISSIIFGISALNIYYFVLIFNTLIDALVSEAKPQSR